MLNNYCVCCGDIIPEGRQICHKCEVAKMMSKDELITVTFTKGENPCLHIKNSYLITDSDSIKSTLKFIHYDPLYKDLQKSGYTRTLQSEYQEWKAHNFLYRIGYKRERTGSVDIDQHEPKLCRFIYAILSIF